jgi:flagellar protein FlbD
MIELTKLNGERYYLNSDLIEMIEMVPDTLVTMTNGKTHYVAEPAAVVVERVKEYKAGILVQAHLYENNTRENHRRRYDRTKED